MFKTPVWLLSLLCTLPALISACGYTLEFKRVKDPKKEDPITVIRREIRQMKADHRVAIFDLQKEHESRIAALQSDLTRLKNANESLGQAAIQMKRDLQETRITMGKKNAEVDDRFTEVELQRRQIHGRIEEEANRAKETSERSSSFMLGEIEALGKSLSAQEAKRKKADKTLTALEQRQSKTQKLLQEQIVSARTRSADLEKTTGQQEETVRVVTEQVSRQGKSLEAISAQVTELIEKVVPSVNELATRLDDLEWQVDQFKGEVDVQGLNKRLDALTESIDVQRQSLEMLGNTLTSQVDKQQGLLRQTIRRVDDLEATLSSETPHQ
ncbi:MAG: hypothetical protein ACE5F7_06295 [Nitrospiria bacterium]